MGNTKQETGGNAAGGAHGGLLDRLIPLGDPDTAAALAGEAVRSAIAGGGDTCLVLMDKGMARESEVVEAVHGFQGAPIVFGAIPGTWPAASRVVTGVPVTTLYGHERFLVVLSSSAAFALIAHPQNRNSSQAHYGGWTVSRKDVVRLAEILLAAQGVPETQALPATPDACVDAASEFATRIMAFHAERVGASRPGAGVNKDDLFSVLDILKAISAKRRAHDILFVFVEQIARVLKVDRCSIVRVWGGDRKGHVLASHEDERVHDLVISLDKYPELRMAMETRERVVINDTARDALTKEFAQQLERASIRSLVVIPIVLFDANVGSLFLRAARHSTGFSPREISFCEIVAEAASNALERAHLFEQIQRTNERLEFLAVTDGLTGLYNHRYFRKRLQEEFDRAVRYGLSLSCLIFDVDNFKRLNDTFGHLQGDSILREMALRITRTVRKSDIVARYGGEEFTIILPQTNLEGATVEAGRLHEELSTHPYQGMPDGQPVTVSIGAATLDHNTMLDSDALLRTADNALYVAKSQGKNRVVVGPVEGDRK